MKEIYLILTHTGSWLSNRIKTYTKKEYSHISISLDKQLNRMYSFGRRNAYNPLRGGFVQEYIDKGTFKRFYNTKCIIYVLNISEESFELLNKKIMDMYKEKEKYKFNFLGLCSVVFNKKIKRKKAFYCAEFVKYILKESKVDLELPEIVKPEDFRKVKGIKEVYKGYLRDYKSE